MLFRSKQGLPQSLPPSWTPMANSPPCYPSPAPSTALSLLLMRNSARSSLKLPESSARRSKSERAIAPSIAGRHLMSIALQGLHKISRTPPLSEGFPFCCQSLRSQSITKVEFRLLFVAAFLEHPLDVQYVTEREDDKHEEYKIGSDDYCFRPQRDLK